MEQRRKVVLRPSFVFTCACALWAARFAFVPYYYERTQELGRYPINGDSIGLPIIEELVVTGVLFPLLMLCLWLILRRFPQRCSWLAWSKKRWAWSAGWTLLFGFFVYLTVSNLVENIQLKLPFNAIANVGWAMVWLELRAVTVSKLTPR